MQPVMSVLGIDMAKRVFHAVGMDERESREMLGVRRPVASPAPQDPCPDTTA
jgi:hypothetical protein